QAEDCIRDDLVTGVQTCALPILVGNNPLVSVLGGLGDNPAYRLNQRRKQSKKLIVIDPRRTETAAKADLHLQPRPAQDAAILARSEERRVGRRRGSGAEAESQTE